ncbi:uncharacterized protein LOC135164105 [Diachasmimorpha longicaudata]|uniref:uncharacterized protein LOC135164105 n=1 Tax=Diachasmimorpha longicaudata TaxID=58733 RepID=UPI0030B89570
MFHCIFSVGWNETGGGWACKHTRLTRENKHPIDHPIYPLLIWRFLNDQVQYFNRLEVPVRNPQLTLIDARATRIAEDYQYSHRRSSKAPLSTGKTFNGSSKSRTRVLVI